MTNNKRYASSWQLPPTVREEDTITRLRQELGITAPYAKPTTRWDARRMIYQLIQRRIKLR